VTRYDFHPEAALDLAQIWDFIAEDSLEAADKVSGDVVARIEALVPFPHQGHKRPDLTSRPLRFSSIHQYLIAYAPDEKPSFESENRRIRLAAALFQRCDWLVGTIGKALHVPSH
jgi:plasmid stabilization system protein ParE